MIFCSGIRASDIFDSVRSGSTITLAATADGYPAPTFQWTKNGVPIHGATGSTLVIPNTSEADSAAYGVIAINSAGSAKSENYILSVLLSVINVEASFLVHPSPSYMTALAGSSHTYSASATGLPQPGYQWWKNGAAIPGATNATLTLSNLSKNDSGTYWVTAKNLISIATSNNSVLTVEEPAATLIAPYFTAQPISQSADAGMAVKFFVSAEGTPAPTYQWFKDGALLSGATSSVLGFASVSSNDIGTYWAAASNSAGTTTSNNATLNVAMAAPAVVAPYFTAHPTSQSADAGAVVQFLVSAEGTPAPTYQWFKNGALLPGATSSVLGLLSVTSNDIGTYWATASNSAGTTTSNTATFNVTMAAPAMVAPYFTVHPVTQTATYFSAVKFYVSANGTPAPTYQWYKNGVPIPGATDAVYGIPQVSFADTGTYVVTATNAAGTAMSQEAVLVVGK